MEGGGDPANGRPAWGDLILLDMTVGGASAPRSPFAQFPRKKAAEVDDDDDNGKMLFAEFSVVAEFMIG